jgi:hypothetical protein
MSDVLKKIRHFMEKQGIPGRDAYDLPSSTQSFPDGANYRIEIAGVECHGETCVDCLINSAAVILAQYLRTAVFTA